MVQSGGGGKRRKHEAKPPPPRGIEDLTEEAWQEMVNEVEKNGETIKNVALSHNLNYQAFKKYVARLMCFIMSCSRS